MKKIFLIGLILALAVLAGGCASAKPKIYVPESELPKTKFVVVEVTTYKEFKVDKEKDEVVYNEPIDEEYGKVFGNTFKKELQERGFIVMPEIPAKDNPSFLIVRVYMANSAPPVPFITNGYIISTTLIYNQMGKLILRLNGITLTSSLITTPSHMVKVKLAPYLAELIVEKFLK